MAKYNGPKCRLCRREGVKLYLKGEKCESQKCTLVKKNYIPGMHGPKGSFGKKSEFGKQLREKQKGKRIYGVNEKKFKSYYQKAAKTNDITSDAILKLLETRLDNVIYRAGLASSRSQARQLVGHGHVRVNGVALSVPSAQIKVGDKFEIVEGIKNSGLYANFDKKKSNAPAWLNVDMKNLKGEVLRAPEKSELENSIAGHLIVEYYSK